MSARILLALPSTDFMYVDTFVSIWAMQKHEARMGHNVALGTFRNTVLYDSRNRLVDTARQLKASHIFFFATDMYAPHDTISRLLAHDLPVVAGGYRQRYKATDAKVLIEMRDGLPMKPQEVAELSGVFRVRMTALDCCLIKMGIFAGWDEPFCFRGRRTEDYCFCDDLADKDIPVYVDFDLTKEVSHLGQWRFQAHVEP